MSKKIGPTAEPLVVRPDQARRLLGIGKTLFFELVRTGRLERVQISERAIGVTMDSVRKLIAQGTKTGDVTLPTPIKRPRSS